MEKSIIHTGLSRSIYTVVGLVDHLISVVAMLWLVLCEGVGPD